MQTLWDETYYLYRTFEGKDSEVGTYLIDDNCVFGVGTKKDDYQGGEVPGTNIILYGHNLSEGRGFGHLLKYEDEAFCKKHPQIHFDTLYEERTYEVMAVFRSQIYDESYGDVFRYYHFTQADSKKEFQAWYKNIKKMSLYDTGVSAKYGDEFITLSTCAYHTDNGRFAVVAKRIK